MVKYKYQALSRDGAKVSGVIEGFNELDAVDRIKESCSVVLKLTPIKDSDSILTRDINANKLNNKAFTMMCSQFAIILRSGIPIGRATHLIADKITDKPLKKVLKQVADDVEGGRSLTEAFEERGGKLFPVIFIETLRAGEQSGHIDTAFDSIYHHFDKQMKMAAKVRSAFAYPAFVLVIAIAVVVVLMVKVVPTFTAIFDALDTELPGITKLLIAISNFFRHWGLPLFGVFALLFIIFKLYSKSEQGHIKVSKLSLNMPVFGNIQRLNAASQFANNMAALLSSGLPITRSLSITARIISNYYTGLEVGKLTSRIEEGRTLTDCVRNANILPPILVDMIGVGEETGELEDTLTTVALYYDGELEQAINSVMAKLEPALLVGLAVIAGFIVIAIYMAMFEMYGAM